MLNLASVCFFYMLNNLFWRCLGGCISHGYAPYSVGCLFMVLYVVIFLYQQESVVFCPLNCMLRKHVPIFVESAKVHFSSVFL